MAFHDYTGNVTRLIKRAEGLYARYKKRVWVTEFAINKWARTVNGKCNNCNITREMTDAYMQEALPLLDQNDAIYRYAWYSARDVSVPGVNAGNLLVANETTPTLTSTGTIYKQFHDCAHNKLPATCINVLQKNCAQSKFPTDADCGECLRENQNAEVQAHCGTSVMAYERILSQWCTKKLNCSLPPIPPPPPTTSIHQN